MFRHREPEPEAPAPVVTRPHKVAPKDSRAFASHSTFATRREQAPLLPAGQRLASLGQTEFQQWHKDRGVDVIPAELFYDVDHPRLRFIRIDGRPEMIALQDEGATTETVTRLPAVGGRRFSKPAGAFPDSPADPPPRPA